MTYDIRTLQQALKGKGFDPGPVDGILGPNTERAISAFKASVGLLARPYVGPITWRELTGKPMPKVVAAKGDTPAGLPWVNEIGKYLGRHEGRDYSTLAKWLKSDGGTLGDPRKFPWCGDAVHTALRLALPDEPYPGKVGRNPYLARNWLDFGVKSKRAYGAVAVFWRGAKDGLSGHVGFIVGVSRDGSLLRIRGGNQSNMVSDSWLKADRLLGYRKPSTWPHALPPAPVMNSRGAAISTNEA